MIFCGPSFGSNQIVPVIFLKKMRSLNPNGLFPNVNTSVNNNFSGANQFHTVGIKRLYPNGSVSVIKRFIGRRTIINNIGIAIIIEKYGGINSVNFGQPDRIRPGAGRICCGYNKISFPADQCIEQVKYPVMVIDSRCKNAI